MVVAIRVLKFTDSGSPISDDYTIIPDATVEVCHNVLDDPNNCTAIPTSDGNGYFNITLTEQDFPIGIRIAQQDYYSYEQIVWNGYGNNLTIDVLLVPTPSHPTESQYSYGHPFFFKVHNPCSYNVQYYNASSLPNSVQWYIDNEVYNVNNLYGIADFCSVGSHQIKMRSITRDVYGNVISDKLFATYDNPDFFVPGETDYVGEHDFNLATDTFDNTFIEEHKPVFQLSLNPPQRDENGCCYYRDELVTIETFSLYNDGTPVTGTVEFIITSPDGTRYNNVQPIDSNGLVTDGLVIDQMGQYTIQAVLYEEVYGVVDTSDLICTNTYEEQISCITCNDIQLEGECGKHRAYNRSLSKSYTFELNYIKQDRDAIPDQEGELEPNTYVDLDVERAGIYIFAITDTNGVYIERYVIINTCPVEDCLASHSIDLLCEDFDPCTKSACNSTSKEFQYVQLYTMWYALFNEISKEYNNALFYDVFDDAKFDDIVRIHNVILKIEEYCARINCNPCHSKGCCNTSTQRSPKPAKCHGRGRPNHSHHHSHRNNNSCKSCR